MYMATSTAIAIRDGILTVLIFLSDLVFKWIPATYAVLFHQTPAGAPIVLGSGGTQVLAGSAHSAEQATQIGLAGAQYDAAGVQTGVVGNGDIQSAASSGAQTLPPSSPEQAAQFGGQAIHVAWSIFAPLSIFISLLFATWIIYALTRLFQVRFAERKALHAAALPHPLPVPEQMREQGPTDAQKRWARVEQQAAAENENDWRLAILEADIMLGDLLEQLNLPGDTIGEKLKAANRSGFTTLDAAWDAHRVRNHIAHRGTMHDITHAEAKRVIAEYEAVFREFHTL